jgi:hypothetical protein
MYVTFNNGYMFFNLPATYQNRHYANHFSIGLKDKNVYNSSKLLVDIHYTIQDYVSQKSINESSKCWLYDGIELDTDTLKEQMCHAVGSGHDARSDHVPKRKKMSDVFSDAYVDYLILILATPFVDKGVLAECIHRVNNPNV